MLDDFRQQAETSSFEEEKPEKVEEEQSHRGLFSRFRTTEETSSGGSSRIQTTEEPPRGNFLGFTPMQRFVLAFMLLLLTLLLGVLGLLITGKVVPGF